MATPSNLLRKLSQQVFSDAGDRDAFIDALVHPQPLAGCILWCQPRPAELPFPVESPLPWQPAFIDRLPPNLESRPGQHPLHQQGQFYCLDFSSVFAAVPWLHYAPINGTVVDVCAAPGGKSLCAWVGLQPQLLVSNEAIAKRIGMLLSNLKRCQVNALIANVDSKLLAEKLPQTSDLVIVDAPCTGQSLLAKGETAPGCFHPVSIQKSVGRQRRILANAAQVVAPGGYLAYMTCTYSPEENEQVCAWLLHQFPHFQPLAVPSLATYQSHLTELPCYRMWPQTQLGAGAFSMVLQNQAEQPRQSCSEQFLTHPAIIRVGVCE